MQDDELAQPNASSSDIIVTVRNSLDLERDTDASIQHRPQNDIALL
jgi:hypothetical protein